MKTDEITHNAQLDLRDEVCPYTFIRTRQALENLAPGRILEVTLRGLAIENVPRSIKEEGHTIVHVERKDDLFVFHIRKNADEIES